MGWRVSTSRVAAVLLLLGGIAAQAGTPELISALGSADVRVRRYAVWELGRDGADPTGIDAIARALEDPDELVTRYAADALVAIGAPSLDSLLSVIDRCSRCGREGERALAEIGAPAVPRLISRLGGDSSPSTRRAAARVLGTIGAEAASAVPALLEAIERPANRADRVELATALGKIGAPALSPVLTRFERELPSDLRELFYRSLAAIGPPAAPAVPMLIESLATDGDVAVRYRAALALGAIGDARAAPALLASLQKDESATVRMYAALALGDVPGDPSHSVGELVAVLGSGDAQVAPRAASALAKIGEPAIPKLFLALEEGNEDARGWAALTLGRIEGARATTVPRLIETFDDPSERVRDQALQAITEVGQAASPLLIAALARHSDPVIRGYAALALGMLDPPPLEALSGLVSAIADPEPRVRQLACWSLGRFGSDAASALPALISALGSDDPLLRRNAVWAIGNMGPVAAQLAETAVAALHTDPDLAVREEASESLEKLHGTYVPGS